MMAGAIMPDCSSIRGSITSSSSDALTLTTPASSWCAIPMSSRIRHIRLVRPHTRRILVAPGATPTFGFAVRGGKEHGTGFFVSNVDRNSEAQQKGLRIGDQILCVNGFNVDDAIHKEFIQLVNKQERLTLKVRSVGMLPVKDEDNGGFFWSAAHNTSVSNTPSESSYQSTSTTATHDRHMNLNERDTNIVLNVAPRTKLGLGICKGPEWKPGIFVQFTKERSVAREAGLRPGDQILSVNSIDFADVLFSEAVAVMRSTNKLDMMIRKGVGCDLFPTESSGYNSSASSVTGDQSPCWADAKSKRLTSVREEITAGLTNQPKDCCHLTPTVAKQCVNENFNRETYYSNSDTSSKTLNKEINKTIIKLSETGASINNTIMDSSPNNHTINKSEELSTVSKYRSTVPAPPPPPPPPPNALSAAVHSEYKTSSVRNGIVCNDAKYDSGRDGGNSLKLGGIAATMQRYQNIRNAKVNVTTVPTNRQITHKINASPIHKIADTPSSLSNAIAEEFKKRKAKQETNPVNAIQPLKTSIRTGINSQNIENAATISYRHSNFISEFKEAHKRMFKNGQKDSSDTAQEEKVNKTTALQQHELQTLRCSNAFMNMEGTDQSGRKERISKTPSTDITPDYRSTQFRHKTSHNVQKSLNSSECSGTESFTKQFDRMPVPRPINNTLSNELQNTLSRLKLRKTLNSQFEHQHHCPLQEQNSNTEAKDNVNISNNMRKQNSQIYTNISKNDCSSNKFQTSNGSIGVSILKNGNRSNTNCYVKPSEKTIKFG